MRTEERNEWREWERSLVLPILAEVYHHDDGVLSAAVEDVRGVGKQSELPTQTSHRRRNHYDIAQSGSLFSYLIYHVSMAEWLKMK